MQRNVETKARCSDLVAVESRRTRIEDAATCLDELTSQHGIRCIVTKQRLVWCLDTTRIHLDRVKGMGTFIELETIVNGGDETEARSEHDRIANMAEIAQVDVVGCSYCDLLPGDGELASVTLDEFR